MLLVSVDRGVNGNSFNMPFVTVTVCTPGTSVCQSVDHVLLDTGSYGLRLFASALSGLSLPSVTNSSNDSIAECAQFVSGSMWGSVRQADVKLAGEVASNIPIQIVGDTASNYTTIPTSCTNTGAIQTAEQLGANGILGVGLFTHDCGICNISTAPNMYFACNANGCTSTLVPILSEVTNPVSAFSINNNGVALTLPAVSSAGSNIISGTLVFGIGTQANNQILSEVVYNTNAQASFTTVYKGVSLTNSFIDSGSNGIFFDDSSIKQCFGFYCPTTELKLSATMKSPKSNASAVVNF
jgi:hypothetical protein